MYAITIKHVKVTKRKDKKTATKKNPNATSDCRVVPDDMQCLYPASIPLPGGFSLPLGDKSSP